MAKQQFIRPSITNSLTERQLANFWAKVEKSDGCWNWVGGISRHPGGYPVLQVNHTPVRAHRISWELVNGPIPDGLVVDHLCRNTRCVNPAHLEPVTFRENVLRGIGITASESRQTHCKRGHPLSGQNLVVRRDGRECRVCKNMHSRASMRRRRSRGDSGLVNAGVSDMNERHEVSDV